MEGNEKLLSHVYTDMLMLQDGSWEPDEESIEATINVIEILADNLKIELKDNRE